MLTATRAAPPIGINDQGRMERMSFALSAPDCTPLARDGQVGDSPAVAQLRQAAEIARREGDRDGYLLAQAAEYEEGGRR